MNHDESRDSIRTQTQHRKESKKKEINNISQDNEKSFDINDIRLKRRNSWEIQKSNKIKKFSSNEHESKKLIIIRVLVLFLVCIYIPLQTFFSPKFDSLEDKLLFPELKDLIPENISTNPLFILSTDYLAFMFSSRDLIMIYIGIIYVVYHPFIAVKIIFVTHFFQFIIVIFRCLLQSHRPIWVSHDKSSSTFCSINFANPSEHFFFICFFYPYLFLSINLVGKHTKKAKTWKKLLYIFLFLIMVCGFGFIMLLKKFNYMYQLNFAFTFAIISLSLVLDLENYIHNFVLNSLKNVIKIRKYKIRFFIIILVMNIIAVLIFNFIEEEPLELIEANEILKSNCREAELTQIGLKSTFLDITYIFGILGTYLGTSLTVEKNCGRWWGLSKMNLTIKIFIASTFGMTYIYLWSLIYTESFEFNYFLSSLKYLLFYYIMMGYIPLLFQKLNLNQNAKPLKKTKSLLFSSSILYNKGGDFRSTEDLMQTKESRKDLTLNNKEIRKDLYSQSILVGGVDPKTKDDRLEFLLSKQTYNQDDDNKKLDDTMEP